MHLIAPDILAEAKGLSLGACATIAALGVMLWLLGWRWHRFWTVIAVTVAGGLYGLSTAPSGGHVIGLAVLLALSAGLMALEVARLFAFAAGGTFAWLVVRTLFPDSEATPIFVLAGGLTGILFYRLWMMVLTSFVGTVLFGHAGFLIAETFTTFDAADWAGRNSVGAGVAVGLVTLLGVAVQGAQARRRPEGEPGWRFWRARHREAGDGDDLPADLRSLREVFRRKGEP